MKSYALYVFDLDGVLYRGDELIPGAVETVAQLRSEQKLVRFLTNNSSETRESRAQKLTAMGFEATPQEVYTSAFGASKILGATSAFVVGEEGLREELHSGGTKVITQHDFAEWVVVGICWNFTYQMLDEAQRRIRDGSKFMATNRDNTFPDSGGRIKPGAGSIVSAIEAAAGRPPDVVVGKPEPFLLEHILVDASIGPDKCLVIGDRLDTDVACANRAGCDSALVLTGVTSRDELDSQPNKPTYVTSSLAEFAARQPNPG
ncbi:MAG: HAD-IIA family hydrolase [Fimbriimonadales bacterium]